MSAIAAAVAASGFLCAIAVLIVERTNARYEINKARREGYLIGYREATAYQDSHEAKFFRGIQGRKEK